MKQETDYRKFKEKLANNAAKYTVQTLTKIDNITREAVESALISSGYKVDEHGYYYKYAFSLLNDAIRYAVRIVEEDSVSKAYIAERERAEQMLYGMNNDCFILMIFSNQVSESEKKELLDVAQTDIAILSVIKDHKYSNTFLPVLIDRNSGTGFFLEMKKKHS